jgi:hypothetical protein
LEGQIVCIPYSNDRLLVKRFDLTSLLQQSTFDYLIITSVPPKSIEAGQTYQYQVSALTRTPARYELESAPEGMRISSDGFIVWAAPQTEEDRVERVSVAISSGADQQFHNFEVLVRGTGKLNSLGSPEGIAGPTGEEKTDRSMENIAAPEGAEMLRLPARYDRVARGGGGRYLLTELKTMRKLAVIDLVKRSVAGYLDLPADDVLFAAGAQKIVIAVPSLRQIQRYDLLSRQWELTAPLTSTKPITAVAMGAASHGPVLIGSGDEQGDQLVLRHLDTLQVRKMTVDGTRHVRFNEGVRVMASADGTVFACWNASHSPTGLQLLVASGDKIMAQYSHLSVTFAAPNADGSSVFTTSGIYDRSLTANRPHGIGGEFVYLPGLDPSQRLRITMPSDNEGDEAAEPKEPSFALLRSDQEESVSRWEALLPEVEKRNLAGRVTTSIADRILLVPDAHVIATLPASNDRVYFWASVE